MASRFKKGRHIFFLMRHGETQLDTQNKPRYYLTRGRAQKYAMRDSEIVEYAPVYNTESGCFVSKDVVNECGLKQLVDELVSLNDENLAQRVIKNNDVQWCLSELQDILAADVVEVIRCKDCKYASEFDGCEDYVEQVRCCTLHKDCDMLPKVWPYDFCSYSKRRGDD